MFLNHGAFGGVLKNALETAQVREWNAMIKCKESGNRNCTICRLYLFNNINLSINVQF